VYKNICHNYDKISKLNLCPGDSVIDKFGSVGQIITHNSESDKHEYTILWKIRQQLWEYVVCKINKPKIEKELLASYETYFDHMTLELLADSFIIKNNIDDKHFYIKGKLIR